MTTKTKAASKKRTPTRTIGRAFIEAADMGEDDDDALQVIQARLHPSQVRRVKAIAAQRGKKMNIFFLEALNEHLIRLGEEPLRLPRKKQHR